jgi:uncharacterized protein (TIGR03083 family)
MADILDMVHVVRTEATRFAQLARRVDLGAPLPHLPGWRVDDLIAHLAGDYQWATSIITTRRAAPGPGSLVERGEALLSRLDELVPAMIAAVELAVGDPDATCPNFAEGATGTLRFWPRRQAHETTVHRWDLEVPTGRHAPIDPAVAADNVDEAFHVYTRRYGGQVLATSLVVRCTDRPEAWRVTPYPTAADSGRVEVARCPGVPAGDIEATADTLLLAVHHRIAVDHPDIRYPADAAAAQAFLAGPLVA